MNSRLSAVTGPSETLMHWLVLATAYVLIVLFLIGTFDVVLGLYELLATREFTDPLALVELLDTVLLLLIIVEVHRTLLAYVRNEPVVRIVVGAAIIAIAREVISFRVGDFESPETALFAAAALAVLLGILVVAFVLAPASTEFGTPDQQPESDSELESQSESESSPN